jgi:formylglycine-generating enzyme required for sulfatase activity/tRNA A-37 threonylcarbamoyl transferase component Bud32/dienelactone hydrolase
MVGETLSHYRVLEKLGEGGMGVVYRALDERLDRKVALKLLRPEALYSPDRRQRFVREARAASALNHPHIVTIYEVGQDSRGGVERDFIAMEHVEGESLYTLLQAKRLTVEEALDIAIQIADALAAAHEAGIVHRDIKPANIMLTRKGEVKLADFGLAKLTEPRELDEDAPTRSVEVRTEEGAVLGTASYMSPEQAEGKPVDCRSDIFSFGSVLYEMLTGRRAFAGDSNVSTRSAILGRNPAPPRSLRPDLPAEVQRVVLRCLEKQREARYASGSELLQDLRRVRARVEQERVRRGALWRRPAVAIPAALLLAAAVAAGTWQWRRAARIRWARTVAIPEITRLNQDGGNIAAFRLARRAAEVLPGDPELERLVNLVSSPPRSLQTDPPGAEVAWKDYAKPESDWERVGVTPLENVRFPAAYLRWRIEKTGFETVEGAGHFFGVGSPPRLHAEGDTPPGMVWVPGGRRTAAGKPVDLDGFWLDKFEVTNREFKKFVDAGAYRRREYWKEPFVKDGREVSWEEGMRDLLDKAGRPGPSTWELGTYPEGEDEHPVRGVSWYEAAAYAEFAGKSLPTIHHWLQATDQFSAPIVLELSNFDGQGPARVGTHQGLGPFGTYDMAGNVKEWCLNRSGEKRYTMGGAWNEVVYMYRQQHAQSPFDRADIYGFRCARYPAPLAAELTAPIERLWRDYSKEKPLDDAGFRLIEGMYAYDRGELNAATEPLESGSPHWRKEKISFNAAYGGERVIAYLFLPVNASPPYQTVVYFPGSGGEMMPSHENPQAQYLDFVIRSGRAVLVPVYKGMYERRLPTPPTRGSRARRDQVIQWYQDLGRSLDYLETRQDVDSERVAYYGFSLGASYGAIFTALEKRFKTSILLAGGYWETHPRPEVDQLNFVSRVRVPTLMLNGREDFRFPLDVSQKPMFAALGTPERDKSHVLVRGGHVPARSEVVKDVLGWLDRYLGPVETKG